MALDESILRDDITVEVKGLPFTYQQDVAEFMNDIVIDLVDTPSGRDIIIKSLHPTAAGACAGPAE